MPTEVEIVKNYFKSKNLHVSEYFIECCLEWVKGEFNVQNDNQKLCEEVYKQWLLTDLTQIGERALPQNLSKEKNKTLQGNFAVQVMYVKDISRSALSQLKNIRNMYKLTRSCVEKEEFEPQGKRVLYMQVTDGVEYIFAFEYETVACLGLEMKPGIKIMLSGPLMVRNGEILLKRNNIKILGGEVEELLITNHPENVLARELKLPENPNPGELTQIEDKCTQNIPSTNDFVPNVPTIPNNRNNENSSRNNDNFQNVNRGSARNDYNARNQSVQASNRNVPCNSENYSRNNDNRGSATNDYNTRNQNVQRNQVQNSANVNAKPSTSSECQFESIPDEFLAEFSTKEFESEIKDINNLDFEDDFTDLEIEEQLNQMNQSDPKSNSPTKISGDPFNYIKQILDNRDQLTGKVVKVKAQLVAVVQKLAFSSSKGWTMKFKISDGTGILVVDFLSPVLEELFGVTFEQALILKEKVKNKNCEVGEKIKELVSDCKNKITLLNCFMGIKVNENSDVATVVWLKPVLPIDLYKLKQRIDIFKNS